MTNLERASHLSVIVLCVGALGLLVEKRLTSIPGGVPREIKERSLVGKTLDMPGVDWSAAPITLVLQISSTCHFCKQSLPFYAKVAVARRSPLRQPQLVVATKENVESMQLFLADAGLSVDKVSQATPTSLSATPVIYVANARGVVSRAFVGYLDSAREKEILSIIERAGSNPENQNH